MRKSKTDKKNKNVKKFTITMQKKLVILFVIILLAFAGLGARLLWHIRENGERYKKQVLSQQAYDSITLPFRRGDILDSKGTALAVSEKVYNLVIDSKVILSKEEYMEPTMQALGTCFELDMTALRAYIQEHPTSAYYVPLKQLTYDQISGFLALQAEDKKIKGVWFEEEYKRVYPQGTLACDVIGFTNGGSVGSYGLEEYYNDTLNGTAGREYGYLNNDSTLERTTKAAVDGYTIYSTIDSNIQRIVEKYLYEFNEQYKDNYREGNGADNLACIIMEVNTGNILAMASYPNFDCNNPRDISAYYTEEEIAAMKEADTYYDTLNELWRNYCIFNAYEPGSTAKPFTVAMGLESGKITGNETYECTGVWNVAGTDIKCNSRRGHGVLDVKGSVANSCNVALMKMAAVIGSDTFAKYQEEFNFGLKTNIDLAGEARTVGSVYSADKMGPVELATNSFGQGFTCTMIQMITGYCSLINGGYYYEPHMVSKIVTSGGATVENIEPRVLKQTVSQSTSDKIIEYCNAVVTDGSGKSARPAGYAIGGKTGTAQTLPRGNGEYIVSFLGYAPADDPQIAIYVVVDRANVEEQANSRLATGIVRNILTEVLPYLHIYMTEELSEEEVRELEERQLEITNMYSNPNDVSGGDVSGGDALGDDVSGGDAGTAVQEPVWKTYEKDPQTGNYIDPETKEQLDPDTGAPVNGYIDALD